MGQCVEACAFSRVSDVPVKPGKIGALTASFNLIGSGKLATSAKAECRYRDDSRKGDNFWNNAALTDALPQQGITSLLNDV